MKPEIIKNKNDTLHKQKQEKNDEYYTLLTDIENELHNYKEHFKDKVIYCNCDDPRVSNFFKYFSWQFEYFGLKKLITTCYKNRNWDMFSEHEDEQAIKIIYKGDIDKNNKPTKMVKKELKGDGDFRSRECVELLKESDIVVTNPPFSLFREFVEQMMLYNKKFIIIGNINAAATKEIFPLIKENKIWLGVKSCNADWYFDIPDHYKDRLRRESKEGSGYVIMDGVMRAKLRNASWYTNLEHYIRREGLVKYKLYKWYEDDPAFYPKYDNYDAIEVNRVADIPRDYKGVMGVPITFLNQYNPNEFEIVGSSRYHEPNPTIQNDINYINGKQIYTRILIKHKNPENKVDFTNYFKDNIK